MFLSETKKKPRTNEWKAEISSHACARFQWNARETSITSVLINSTQRGTSYVSFGRIKTSVPDRYNQLGPHASWPWKTIASSWETLYTLSLSLPFVAEIVHSYYIDMSKLLHLANHADKISKHPASEERKECNTHDLCTHALWKSPSWTRMTGMNVQLWFFQGVGHSSAEFHTCFALTCRL